MTTGLHTGLHRQKSVPLICGGFFRNLVGGLFIGIQCGKKEEKRRNIGKEMSEKLPTPFPVFPLLKDNGRKAELLRHIIGLLAL